MNDQDRRQVRSLGLEVAVSIPGAADFVSVARRWFAEVPRLLAPAEWEAVLRADKPPFRGTPLAEWPLFDDFQEPFMVWAQIIVAPLKWRGMRIWQRRATARNLAWLDEVLADRPVSVTLSVFRVDRNGIQLPGGLSLSAEAALGVGDVQVPVGQLVVGDSFHWRPGGRPADAGELCARQAGLAREWAGCPGVINLFGGEEIAAMGGSALAYSLPPTLNWWEVALRCDMPGYSWISLCPAGAVARLGGAAALEASGAFHKVEKMPGGAVLLQVTERPADYGLCQARKVFDVLAPVLPEGMPEKPANWAEGLPWLVIPEDAARHQGPPPRGDAGGGTSAQAAT
jgi:hypothetical protein